MGGPAKGSLAERHGMLDMRSVHPLSLILGFHLISALLAKRRCV